MENKILDGNSACANIAFKLSQVCAIYPITPSSPMAESVEQLSTNNKNIFDENVIISQLQSEAGVAGAVHGALVSGSLATTFTSSQGLLLMIPNMYKIAGENLPCVFHISSRAIATHALSIFGDHSDVMAVRQTGFIILSSTSVQECQDLALASHILSLECSLPVVHFFDGFTTSHQLQKIQTINDDNIKSIFPYEKLWQFKSNALSPTNPSQKGTAQNPDVFFQNREACNTLYDNVYTNLEKVLEKIQKITNRNYKPYEYFGDENAETIIVCMGSSFQTLKSVTKYLNKQNKKVGVLLVRLYRPFFAKQFMDAIPKSVKTICVLDRTKECGSNGEPLYLDVCCAVLQNNKNINVIGGRYGLGGKDFSDSDAISVFENAMNKTPKNNFTVSINDDVTNLSLTPCNKSINDESVCIKFYGFGSDGTVSATKNTIKMLGEEENKYVQGFFEYDSKKSGSLTISYIRQSGNEILQQYTPKQFDYISINNFIFVSKYDLISNLKQNGVVILNSPHPKQSVANFLPKSFIATLKQKNAKLFIIDAYDIAKQNGLGRKINTIMQTAFFTIKQENSTEQIIAKQIQLVEKTYKNKGEAVVCNNINAINQTQANIQQVDYSNFESEINIKTQTTNNEFVDKIILPVESLQGNNLPVSAFTASGTIPTNTSKYLKRGVAEFLPCYNEQNCIQCGLCALACPHGAIKPVLIDKQTKKPINFKTATAYMLENAEYRMQVNPKDCTGCGVCSNVCPTLKKALEMKKAEEVNEQENYEFSQSVKQLENPFNKHTVKGISFQPNYFEFSGACAGCGETPYIKLLTQLFGNRLQIANATGCSSIYGGSYPVCPYTKNKQGFGPAWANSLFEDNAEFGFGMALANKQSKQKTIEIAKQVAENENENEPLKNLLSTFVKNEQLNEQEYLQTIDLLTKSQNKQTKQLLDYKTSLFGTSVWIIGGDGWAYDIGYGGLDHVASTGENVNILILDTECYSNTGGQTSKASTAGSVLKFSASGKKTNKKNLGEILMNNKNCFVGSISLGANPAQAIETLVEAEKFNGVSVVICYCPCITHGFDMSKSNEHMKNAVTSGYFNLYSFDPSKQNPLKISSIPNAKYEDFLSSENRFNLVKKVNPKNAEILLEKNKQNAENNYQNLKTNLENFKKD